MSLPKTRAWFFPFDLFGSGGTAAGAQLLADAVRELLADNRREDQPIRSRCYQHRVAVNEVAFDTLEAYQNWRKTARQTIRRVFGNAFAAREQVVMPPPGDLGPARLTVTLRDLVWDALYAPIAGAVGFAADHLNHLQFLTIRRYLSLVFLALVSLLLALTLWQ